jgi:hypothetical protein
MNYARIFSILAQLGMEDEDQRRNIIYNFTKGRTSSLKDLSYKEYMDLCKSLEPHSKEIAARLEQKRWRSNCLHLLQKIGVDTADWDSINAYCLSPKIANKKFRDISCDELITLYKKLQSILKKKIKITI